jgi:NAD(P)H-dependent FMN reductase
MSQSPKILAFSGSAREASFNKRLIRLASAAVEAAGVPCTLIDLRDYPLPIYDGDLEDSQGLPAPAAELRELCTHHTGFLIAAPEYNGSIPALLKNTIDWMTRSAEGTPDLACFNGKVAALMSASPGPLGGMRGLAVLRNLLGNLGVTVLANQFTLRKAAQAFTGDGRIESEHDARRVEGLAAEFAGVAQRWGA